MFPDLNSCYVIPNSCRNVVKEGFVGDAGPLVQSKGKFSRQVIQQYPPLKKAAFSNLTKFWATDSEAQQECGTSFDGIKRYTGMFLASFSALRPF